MHPYKQVAQVQGSSDEGKKRGLASLSPLYSSGTQSETATITSELPCDHVAQKAKCGVRRHRLQRGPETKAALVTMQQSGRLSIQELQVSCSILLHECARHA